MVKIYQFIASLILISFSGFINKSEAATYYTRGVGGAWTTAATWSTIGCNGTAAATYPGPMDDVIICNSSGTGAVSVTVAGAQSCRNLTIGTGAANATLNFSTGTQSLIVNGDVYFNTGNNSNIYSISAGTSTFTVNGNINWNTSQGTNKFLVSSGILNFVKDVSLVNDNQYITITSSGKVNFLGNFTDSQNKLGTSSTCSVSFFGNYTVNDIPVTWVAGAFAIFKGTSISIVPNAAINFSNLTVGNILGGISSATATAIAGISVGRELSILSDATFNVSTPLSIGYSVTLASASILNLNADLTVARNWTNNGGTLNGGTQSVRLKGYNYIVGGSSSTNFPHLYVGTSGGTTRVKYTQNCNISCLSFTLEDNSYASSSTYSLNTITPYSLAISGNLTIKQLIYNSSNSLYVNAGNCTVGGDLLFSGSGNASTAQIVQVITTSGTFTLSGIVTWLNQAGAALVVTEIISVGTGTLTFNSSIDMPKGSGVIKVTGAGTINFNGSSAPSIDCNSTGASTLYASLSTVSGSTVNIYAGITNAYTLTFAAGSFVNFTGTGTINAVAALKFGHLKINGGKTVTAAGSFGLQNTWTNIGTFVPGVNTVTFSGTSTTIQSVAKSGGETFYGLAVATSSATLTLLNDVTIENMLTMSGHKIDMGGNTLIVGNNSGAGVSRTKGQIYNGTYKRYWPASTAITTSTSNKYGLFPIGTTASYRPVLIASTASPTSGGYVQVNHNGINSVTDVDYNDGVHIIERISDQSTTLSTSGITGGTYNIDVYFGGFGSGGALADLKLETYTGGINGAVGTHATSTVSVSTPTLKRTGLTAAQLNNVFVAGTKNKANTGIVQYYYSRVASGDWNDPSSWSTVGGGSGASCSCVPPSTSSAVISTGQTISITTAANADFVTVSDGAVLNGSANLIVGKQMDVNGTGTINPSAGTWSIADLNINGSGASYSSAIISASGDFIVNSGAQLIMNAGLTITGDLVIDGTLSIGSNTVVLNGPNTVSLSGSGNINGSGGTLSITTANKNILPSANLSLTTNISLANSITLTNNGTVTTSGNITGGNSSSTWINASGSTLNSLGAILTTGTLNASAIGNIVDYRKSSAQTIKNTTYDMLTIRNTGTKTLNGNTVVNSLLTILDLAVLDETTYKLTGACDVAMFGTSELKMQRSTGGTYPEPTGSYDLTGGQITLNQTAGTAILQEADYSNLKLNGNGTYNLVDVISVASDLDIINNALAINLGAITIGGSLNYSTSGTATLSDDITTARFVLSGGTFKDGGHQLTITGADFIHSGGTFTSSGIVLFNGSAAQTISGSISTTFNELNIANSNGVTLSQPVIVTSELGLLEGKLNTDAVNFITLNDNAIATQNSVSNFVNGVMKKVGDDAFIFPIGDGSQPGRVGISAPASASTVFSAKYNAVEYGNPETVIYPLAWASHLEHWLLDRTGSASGIEVTLFWENSNTSMIDNCDVLTIAHWNGTAWQQEDATAIGSCSGGSGSITTNYELFSFSPFSFGSNDPHDNPLPVELIDFNAEVSGENVDVNWSTASEINSHYFSVERSSDGVEFKEIMKVNGNGNSSVTNRYATVDTAPLRGISYYRLKQIDFNGDFTYSNSIPVEFNSTKINPNLVVNLFPQPCTNGNLNIQLNSKVSTSEASVQIIDLGGKTVYNSTINLTETNVIKLNAGLLPGFYFLIIQSGGMADRVPLLVVE